jgi:hypothetical protein
MEERDFCPGEIMSTEGNRDDLIIIHRLGLVSKDEALAIAHWIIDKHREWIQED